MMTRILSLLLILGGAGFAQEKSAEPEYRFLFVIDNSFSMRRKKEAVVKTVRDLIATGFHNQAEDGERFGIWTFSDKVQKQFPSQVWNRRESEQLAAIAAQFLDSQKPEGKSDLLLALLEMDKYASDDRDMLVILFCEGDEGVAGTPFDGEINRIFMEYHRILQRSRKPFLLSFAYHRGLMQSARVFYGNGVVELPELVRRQEKRIRELVQAVPVPAAASETNTQSPVAVAIVPAEVPFSANPIPPRSEQKPQQDMREVATAAEPRRAIEEPKPVIPPSKPAEPEPKPVVQEIKPATEEPKKRVEEIKSAVQEPKPPVPEPKPAVQEPIVASVQPNAPQLPPTEPAPVRIKDSPPPSTPPAVAKSEPPKPIPTPALPAEQTAALEPVESTPFKPSNNAALTATPGMITPSERFIVYWPFITAALALLALAGYWIWNKRKARPSASFISQSIER